MSPGNYKNEIHLSFTRSTLIVHVTHIQQEQQQQQNHKHAHRSIAIESQKIYSIYQRIKMVLCNFWCDKSIRFPLPNGQIFMYSNFNCSTNRNSFALHNRTNSFAFHLEIVHALFFLSAPIIFIALVFAVSLSPVAQLFSHQSKSVRNGCVFESVG